MRKTKEIIITILGYIAFLLLVPLVWLVVWGMEHYERTRTNQ